MQQIEKLSHGETSILGRQGDWVKFVAQGERFFFGALRLFHATYRFVALSFLILQRCTCIDQRVEVAHGARNFASGSAAISQDETRLRGFVDVAGGQGPEPERFVGGA